MHLRYDKLHAALSPLAFVHPAVLRNARFLLRLVHGVIAAAPSLLVLAALRVTDEVLVRHYLVLAALSGVLCVMVFQAFGLYGCELFGQLAWLRRTFFAWSTAFGLMLALHVLFRYAGSVPPALFVFWFLSVLGLFAALRLAMLEMFRRQASKGALLSRVVILGCAENGRRLAAHLRRRSDAGACVLGFVDDCAEHYGEEARLLLPFLGGLDALERLIREGGVDQVLVALPWSVAPRLRQYVKRLARLPVNVMLVPDMAVCEDVPNRPVQLAGLPMFNVADAPLTGWSPLLKRIEDLLLASLAVLLLAPVLALVAVAVKLDSPGPVLFRQKRYGYNHRLIEVYKFRSMHHHLRDADAGCQTTRGDARVTRVGRFIRRTSLDELPQLFNVLAGSMSLVGPRPHATATKAADVLFEEAVEEYAARHRVKPGMTGLAQIRGYRGETDTLEKIEKRVEYDLYYIEHWSLWLDLCILLRTPPAVLRATAAY